MKLKKNCLGSWLLLGNQGLLAAARHFFFFPFCLIYLRYVTNTRTDMEELLPLFQPLMTPFNVLYNLRNVSSLLAALLYYNIQIFFSPPLGMEQFKISRVV